MSGKHLHAPVKGVFKVHGQVMRYDTEIQGQKMGTLIDMKAQKVTILMTAQKMAMDTSFDPAQHGPACATDDWTACLTKQGFKRTGQETVNGHPCELYEGSHVIKGKKYLQKLWRPTDLKEAPMMRSVTQTDEGEVMRMEITDLKTVQFSAADFQVPAGYQKLGNMENLMKGMMSIPGK